MNFKEQIKSPKWQKRRLEILNRDNFTCQACGATDETLHVHHIKYIKNKMYWDYPDEMLITMCDDCHDTEHSCKDDFIQDILRDLNSCGFTYIEICGMVNYIFKKLILNSNGAPKLLTDIFNGDDLSYFKIGDVDNISKWRSSLKK